MSRFDTIVKVETKNTQIYVETRVLEEKPRYFSSYYFLIIKKVQKGNIYRQHEPNKKNKELG